MSRFLERQLKSAESKKLGRTEYHYEFGKDAVTVTHRAADQATKPRMVVLMATPAEGGMGVKKP